MKYEGKSAWRIFLFGLFLPYFFFNACRKFEYSPYEEKKSENPSNLNAVNIDRIHSSENIDRDTVTILFTGDSQRFYYHLDKLVAKTNEIPNIDFLILAGDITDFGLEEEFNWIYERLQKLNVPYLCVVGNHDLTANGSEIYERIFGEKNFTLHYKNYKFLFFDSNSRENNFNGNVPDINWLSNELSNATDKWKIVVSHIPPFNEGFDRNLEFPYKDLLASSANCLLSLHGHLHGSVDTFYYADHVRYMTTFSVDKEAAILLKLINGKIIKQVIYY